MILKLSHRCSLNFFHMWSKLIEIPSVSSDVVFHLEPVTGTPVKNFTGDVRGRLAVALTIDPGDANFVQMVYTKLGQDGDWPVIESQVLLVSLVSYQSLPLRLLHKHEKKITWPPGSQNRGGPTSLFPIIIRPLQDGHIMLWRCPSVRLSIHLSVCLKTPVSSQ